MSKGRDAPAATPAPPSATRPPHSLQTRSVRRTSQWTAATSNRRATARGLRWNAAERVETFTDPLWVFLVSAAVAVTREFYFTTIALSLALSIGAVALYVTRAAADSRTAAAGVLMLLCSKAFVDYSTGGL